MQSERSACFFQFPVLISSFACTPAEGFGLFPTELKRFLCMWDTFRDARFGWALDSCCQWFLAQALLAGFEGQCSHLEDFQ